MSHVVLLSLFFSFLSFSALLSTKNSGIYLLRALSLVSHEIFDYGTGRKSRDMIAVYCTNSAGSMGRSGVEGLGYYLFCLLNF